MEFKSRRLPGAEVQAAASEPCQAFQAKKKRGATPEEAA